MPQCIKRLGDTKDGLREKARAYFIKTVEIGANIPGNMIERMVSLFSQKNSNIGIEAQKVVLGTLEYVRAQNTSLSPNVTLKLVKAEVKALGFNSRDNAEIILLDLGKNVNPRLIMTELEKERKGVLGSTLKNITGILDTIRNVRLEI